MYLYITANTTKSKEQCKTVSPQKNHYKLKNNPGCQKTLSEKKMCMLPCVTLNDHVLIKGKFLYNTCTYRFTDVRPNLWAVTQQNACIFVVNWNAAFRAISTSNLYFLLQENPGTTPLIGSMLPWWWIVSFSSFSPWLAFCQRSSYLPIFRHCGMALLPLVKSTTATAIPADTQSTSGKGS